ncbi:unnamed protein product [Sphagnum troendelagicum]
MNASDTGHVIVSTVPLQPYIWAIPNQTALLTYEDAPLPSIGAFDKFAVANPNSASVMMVEVSAQSGRLFPASGMSNYWLTGSNLSITWQPVIISIGPIYPPHSDDYSSSNVTSGQFPLAPGMGYMQLQSTVDPLNQALQALQYIGNRNFNGDDLITMKAKDGTGLGDIRSVEVTVLPVNDPPSITAPFMADLSTLASTSLSNNSVTTLPLPAIAVADPDEFDIRTDGSTYLLEATLQVNWGLLYVTLPNSSLSSAKYRVDGNDSWTPIDGTIAPKVLGMGIKFQSSVEDCNKALSTWQYQCTKCGSRTTMVDLSIVVDDLGNFGCSQNCSTSLIESLLAHAHIQVWLVAPNPPLTLAGKLKLIAYVLGPILGTLLLCAGCRSLCEWMRPPTVYYNAEGFLVDNCITRKTNWVGRL